MKLEWNVYTYDLNSKKIEVFNIFRHARFYNNTIDALKKYDDKEEFSKMVRSNLLYYYWSKCEWEIVITSWTPHIGKEELDRLNSESEKFYKENGHYPYSMYIKPDVSKKIDVYDQVMLNYDAFIEYLWSKKGE